MTPLKGQPSPRKGKTYPPEILTEDEVLAMMKYCSLQAPTGIRNRALITVIYRAGLRISEALALRCADVDVNNGTIRVLHGKGDKARTVGMDEGAMAVVQRWMDTRKGLGIRANGHPLFCLLWAGQSRRAGAKAGDPMSDRYVRDMLKTIAAKAGIEKNVRPHGLRHSHAAELSAEGVPVNVVQQQLGHASLAVTDKYLRHIAPADVIAMGRQRKWFTDEESAQPAGDDLTGLLRLLAGNPEAMAALAKLAAEAEATE